MSRNLQGTCLKQQELVGWADGLQGMQQLQRLLA